MTYKFSALTGCFYPDEITYPSLPADVVEATTDQFALAMARGPQDTLAVVDGAVVIVPYTGPTLDHAKADQIAAINQAYQVAISAPVSFTTAAGATVSFPETDDAKTYLSQCIAAGANAWTLNLWLDATNSPVAPFTFADLQGLAAAMEAKQSPSYKDLLDKVAAVNAATTVAAVRAISF